MSWSVSAEVAQYDQAVTWFRSRVPYTTAQFDDLEDKSRARAFAIAGNLELDSVQTVFDELGASIEKGTPFEEFQKRVAEKLQNKMGPDGYHLETVFRNWTQTAYNTGRWYQLTDPDLLVLRPMLMADAVLDSRTTEVCKSIDGVIKPADDAFWLTHWPPLHNRCRTGIRSLRRKEAERRGITEGDPHVHVDGTFGLAPPLRHDDEILTPQQSRFEPGAWDEYIKRQQKAAVELRAENDNAKKRRKKRDQRDPAYWYEKEFKTKYSEPAGKAVAWGKAMEQRGRALTLEEASAAHQKLLGVGAKASPFSDDLLERAPTLRGKGIKGAKDVGSLIDALDDAGHVTEARELRVTSSLIGHAQSIEVGAGPDFPIPSWRGTWTTAAKERLVQDHEHATEFLAALTDKSIIAPKVKLVAKHDRAGYLSGTINVRGREFAGDLVHEWGHALEEYNAPIRNAARQFLAVRTASEPARKLNVLLPGRAYRMDEVAKKDGFFSPYMGKIYPGGETELTSMGLDLIRTQQAAELYLADPEHFWLALGMLAGGKIP